jgi:hypothetical protein
MGLSFLKNPLYHGKIRGHVTYSVSPYTQTPAKSLLDIGYMQRRLLTKVHDNKYYVIPALLAWAGTVYAVHYLEKKDDEKAWF